MITFDAMGLPEALNHTLVHMKFSTPTPIQAQAIPIAMDGKDILGSAQTGTGKTGAFGIPVVTKLMNDPTASALIMTPTRELASQVMKQLQDLLGRRSNIKTALLIGGESMIKQFRQLDHSPRLVVGTPGRINDHLEREKLTLDTTSILVLDETDRMLDMGFSIQIDAIMDYMPTKRQTLLFSATLPKNIMRMTDKYLQNPVRIAVDPVSIVSQNIKQDVLKIADAEKYPQLLKELDQRAGSVIVFMKTKHATEKMATKLSLDGVDAKAIHGDLRQNKRESVVAAFRKQKYRVLVATDVAARGLDIPHIEHVINYDPPQCPEDYIHRIGRTGRAGATGEALSFVSPRDKGIWVRIDRLMNPDKQKSSGKERFEDDDFGMERRPRKNFKSQKRLQNTFEKRDAKPFGRDFSKKRFTEDRDTNFGDRTSSPRPKSGFKKEDRDTNFGDRISSPRPKSGFKKKDTRPSAVSFSDYDTSKPKPQKRRQFDRNDQGDSPKFSKPKRETTSSSKRFSDPKKKEFSKSVPARNGKSFAKSKPAGSRAQPKFGGKKKS